MAGVKIPGISTDDDGNIIADPNSPFGQQLASMFQPATRNVAPNFWAVGAEGFRTITGLIDQDTARTLRRNLVDDYDDIESLRANLDSQIAQVGDAAAQAALTTLARIESRQQSTLRTEMDLADLQRRQSINQAIGGGMGLAGQFTSASGGGGGFSAGSIGGGGGMGLLPAAAIGAGAYLVGRDSRYDRYEDRYDRRR